MIEVTPEERLLAHVLCQYRRCWRCRLWPKRRHAPWWRDDKIAQRLHFHRAGDCPRCGRRNPPRNPLDAPSEVPHD